MPVIVGKKSTAAASKPGSEDQARSRKEVETAVRCLTTACSNMTEKRWLASIASFKKDAECKTNLQRARKDISRLNTLTKSSGSRKGSSSVKALSRTYKGEAILEIHDDFSKSIKSVRDSMNGRTSLSREIFLPSACTCPSRVDTSETQGTASASIDDTTETPSPREAVSDAPIMTGSAVDTESEYQGEGKGKGIIPESWEDDV